MIPAPRTHRDRIAAVPVPARMAHLPKDRRGYPIPVIVTLDRAGEPLFTINDEIKGDRCAAESLCTICGGELEVGDMWWVGGPLSALHPNGAFMDGAMHEECSTYAMRVCPYIAMPSYGKRIDAAQAAKNGLDGVTLIDATQIPDRPLAFFQCRSVSFNMKWPRLPGLRYFVPVTGFAVSEENFSERWLDIRVWQDGEQVAEEHEGRVIREAITAALKSAQEHLGDA